MLITDYIETCFIEKLDYKLLNNKELAEKLDIRYIVNGTLWKLDSIFQLSLEVFDTKSSKILLRAICRS